MRWGIAGLVTVVACLLVAAVTPSVTTWAVTSALQRRGYVACPAMFWEKPVRQRWAMPEPGEPFGHCPTSTEQAARVDAPS